MTQSVSEVEQWIFPRHAPIPLKPLEGSAVNPYSMFSVETPIDECLLSCNKTAVALTGEDPCAAGGITDPSFNSMGCYDIGTMAPKDMGVCGYNCSVFHNDIDTPTMCTAEDAASGDEPPHLTHTIKRAKAVLNRSRPPADAALGGQPPRY